MDKRTEPVGQSRPKRAADKVTVAAFEKVAWPGPHGIEDLGRHLIEAHGGLDAALGWLALRLLRLERDR